MTVLQLNYAVVIAEQGSMNKAAQLLYTSQPSLTSAVQELERELGITIFYRSGRGVTPTPDGEEFLVYARGVLAGFEELKARYCERPIRRKFGVSTQHYSFAVKAFVGLVGRYDTAEYDFAIRETSTRDVISDVAKLRSEIGILYLSSFNRAAITKLLQSGGLEFHSLIECGVYVYLWQGHPLAQSESITFEQLREYPCLSFEQGDGASFYFSEEIRPTAEYPRVIKACDRATMLNLMKGLYGYTLCSGIISEELNGGEYKAVPFICDDDENTMEIGYIVKKNTVRSRIGQEYIEQLERELGRVSSED